MHVKITPNTNRLRQLVRDHGDVWLVLKDARPMVCFNGQLGLLVESLDGEHIRNVQASIAEVVEHEET